MQGRAAVAVGAIVSLNVIVASAVLGARPAAGSHDKEVREQNVDANGFIRVHEQGTSNSRVTNLPLDEAGRLKVSGSAAVTGTVAASQSGTWTVGLDPAASVDLGNIAGATSGMSYDAGGNLRVSVAGGSAADPSVASRSPFGYSAHSTIPAGDSVTIDAADPTRVTAISFHTDHDVIVTFSHAGSVMLGLRVPANQSVVQSFAHAVLADSMQVRCLGGSACTVLKSVAAY
jgi:hypothetical protein